MSERDHFTHSTPRMGRCAPLLCPSARVSIGSKRVQLEATVSLAFQDLSETNGVGILRKNVMERYLIQTQGVNLPAENRDPNGVVAFHDMSEIKGVSRKS